MRRHAMAVTAVLTLLLIPRVSAQNTFRDDFNSLVPGSGWSWSREDRSAWRLTGSHLEITTQKGALNETQYNNVKNLLLRTPLDSSFTIETKVTFKPDQLYHNAGIVYYVDDDNYIRVSRGWSEFVNGVWFESEINGVVTFEFNPNVVDTTVWLRLERKNINGRWKFAGTWSVNGVHYDYIAFAKEVALDHSKAKVGLQAANGDGPFATSERIPALFDFYVEYATTAVDPVAASTPAALDITSVSPNPAVAGVVSVHLTTHAPMQVRLAVVDMLGRTLLARDVDLATGERMLPLDVRGLAAGTYSLVATSQRSRSARTLQIVR